MQETNISVAVLEFFFANQKRVWDFNLDYCVSRCVSEAS